MSKAIEVLRQNRDAAKAAIVSATEEMTRSEAEAAHNRAIILRSQAAITDLEQAITALGGQLER